MAADAAPPRRAWVRRHPWRAAGLFVAAVLVFLTGAGGVLLWYATDSMTRVTVDGTSDEQDADTGGAHADTDDADSDGADDPDDAGLELRELESSFTVLVAGSDARHVLSPEEQVEYSTGDVEGERTESIMLVRVDPERDRAAILNFPRDLLVTRCDGSVGRINAAYHVGEESEIGGGSCLVRTVTALSGIGIDHFVKVDFRGFVEIVEAVGGITLHLDEPIRDERAGLDVPDGCVTLDGGDALAFARARSIDNDFGRIARQQRLVGELIDEVVSLGTLANVPRMIELVDAVARSVEVDETLGPLRMRRIAASLQDLTGERLVTDTVPGSTRVNGRAFLDMREDEAETLFASFRDGTVFAELDEQDTDASPGQAAEDDERAGEPAEADEPGGDDERAEEEPAEDESDSTEGDYRGAHSDVDC